MTNHQVAGGAVQVGWRVVDTPALALLGQAQKTFLGQVGRQLRIIAAAQQKALHGRRMLQKQALDIQIRQSQLPELGR